MTQIKATFIALLILAVLGVATHALPLSIGRERAPGGRDLTILVTWLPDHGVFIDQKVDGTEYRSPVDYTGHYKAYFPTWNAAAYLHAYVDPAFGPVPARIEVTFLAGTRIACHRGGHVADHDVTCVA